ncbi:hypothetical protein NIES4073_84050 [Kalymmatonema gypsitolerans NIES-4073]|nr:hypothetical protein NIES4073_84050 [Scytonema sp. NIES-4073]
MGESVIASFESAAYAYGTATPIGASAAALQQIAFGLIREWDV